MIIAKSHPVSLAVARKVSLRKGSTNALCHYEKARRSNLRLALALFPPVSLRGGNDEAISSQRRHCSRPCHCEEATTKQSQLAAAPTPDCFTAFAMTPQEQHHRPRIVSLRGGTTKQSQASGGPNPRLLHFVRNDTPKTTPDCFTSFAMTLQKPPQIASLRSQ